MSESLPTPKRFPKIGLLIGILFIYFAGLSIWKMERGRATQDPEKLREIAAGLADACRERPEFNLIRFTTDRAVLRVEAPDTLGGRQQEELFQMIHRAVKERYRVDYRLMPAETLDPRLGSAPTSTPTP